MALVRMQADKGDVRRGSIWVFALCVGLTTSGLVLSSVHIVWTIKSGETTLQTQSIRTFLYTLILGISSHRSFRENILSRNMTAFELSLKSS